MPPSSPERAVDEDDVDGGAEAGDGLDLQHVGLHLLGEGQLLGQLKRSKVIDWLTASLNSHSFTGLIIRSGQSFS